MSEWNYVTQSMAMGEEPPRVFVRDKDRTPYAKKKTDIVPHNAVGMYLAALPRNKEREQELLAMDASELEQVSGMTIHCDRWGMNPEERWAALAAVATREGFVFYDWAVREKQLSMDPLYRRLRQGCVTEKAYTQGKIWVPDWKEKANALRAKQLGLRKDNFDPMHSTRNVWLFMYFLICVPFHIYCLLFVCSGDTAWAWKVFAYVSAFFLGMAFFGDSHFDQMAMKKTNSQITYEAVDARAARELAELKRRESADAQEVLQQTQKQ